MSPAGKFTKRITIQEINPEAVPDAAGQVEREDDANWREVFSRWAWFVPQTGREFVQAKQQRADVTHVIRVPWDPGTNALTPDMRIRFFDHLAWRTLDIVDCHAAEAEREVEIRAVERK